MTPLVVLSHLRWSFVFQRPQQLMSRLSKHYEVLFVEEPVFDSGAAYFESVRPLPHVEVLIPHTSVGTGGFHDEQLPVLQALLRDELARRGIKHCILWLYTPMAQPLISAIKPQTLIYDCMDELSAFKDAPVQLHEREAALMREADLVLTGGPALYDAKVSANPQVHCLPSAVDAQHFSPENLNAESEQAVVADELHRGIAHPRLGFFGVIDERLDIELLADVARLRPQWQFIMAGPVVKIDPATLPAATNIHWLGMQPYARLPYLMAQWDLCVMPFAMNESTRFISPTKTLEYMAGGKSVVSTPVADVVRLYSDSVRIAADVESFVQASEEALAESGSRLEARRVDMARAVALNSWDHCAEHIHGLIEELSESFAAPMPRYSTQIPASSVVSP